MWRHKLKDWEKVEIDVYKFCFSEAVKRLDQTLDEGEKITDRAYKLVAVAAPLAGICAGVIANKIDKKLTIDLVAVLAIISGIALWYSLYNLWRVITVRNVWLAGTEPQDVLLSDYVENTGYSGEEHSKYLFLSTLEVIQDKITNNCSENSRRISEFATALKLIIVFGLISFASLIAVALT